MEVKINKKNIASWAMFDFANNAFPTLVITFLYSAYFKGTITPEPLPGESEPQLWALGIGISAIFIAVLSPIMGALADETGRRKQYLVITALICICFTWLLFIPRPGDVWLALIFVIIANASMEICNVFYNGLLPEIAPKKDMGKISGIGWGISYIGGFLCLLSVLFLFIFPDGEPGFFGLVPEKLKVPASMFFVGGWFLLFASPMFFLFKLPKAATIGLAEGKNKNFNGLISETFSELWKTLKLIFKDYRNVFWLLLSRLFYNDGLVTIFSFGSIYAAAVFGFGTAKLLIFGIVINVAAGIGAIIFGFLEDKIGSKKMIKSSLIGLMLCALVAVFAPNEGWFWFSAVTVGILTGPNQSASRSLMAKFVPDKRENEFFGLFAFSGKATAFLAPMAWFLLVNTSGGERLAMSSVIVFFSIGLYLLTKVNESQGIEDSQKTY